VLKSPEDFLKPGKPVPVFALICCNLDADGKPRLRDVLRKMRNIKNYNNVFDPKNASILPDYKEENHDINLLPNKKSLYGLLYSLFEKKLDILQEYLLKNLALSRICEFISPAGAPVLFVPKSDSSLRLCVDYRNLNIITIKNRCSLSLIEKTLDRLIDAAYFIKLDFKNAYYRIRIRQDNK